LTIAAISQNDSLFTTPALQTKNGLHPNQHKPSLV
jgi:hypothetical protein